MTRYCIVLALVGAGCDSRSIPDADDGTYNCATETRGDTYTAALEKPGEAGALDFKLMSAVPAPPARGDNLWMLQINTLSGGVVGAPLTGATLKVTPYMPDHMHGTGIPAILSEPTPGQYRLDRVHMPMAGLWQTTIEVDGAVTDKVVYSFCLPS